MRSNEIVAPGDGGVEGASFGIKRGRGNGTDKDMWRSRELWTRMSPSVRDSLAHHSPLHFLFPSFPLFLFKSRELEEEEEEEHTSFS